ncbi:phosphodiester glycosidase family protein [Mycobacterium sp. IS-1496]|uniref:phosphodiester glycosidase family protein n=1 Tax=Mycobacterium sp. IS-1496 TaxID=1772284 RepID=UPI000A3FEEDC|nr:phosphodiester glycosidase family protein [Mycobacterium sp. IS-1496]
MPISANALRRFTAGLAAFALCAALSTTGQPHARASDPKSLLLGAIANTKGAYLVYNFGGEFAAPFRAADGREYTLNNGGHLMTVKNASSRLNPRLLVDTHQGFQARCERDPRARTGEGLFQASETFTPLQAWQALGQPTIAINANFFDVRGQKGGSWRDTGCSSPLGAYVDNTRGQGRANAPITGTIAYAGKQGLSGGNETWSALATMILPVGGAPYVVMPNGKQDFDAASPEIQKLMDRNARFVAVAGLGLLAPGSTGQLNDPGPSAARTAIAYSSAADQLYVFQGGNYTPDNMQDLFRGLGAEHAVLLDGGGSSAIVLRRDTGGMWSGAGSPRGSCDTRQVLCDSRERALPSWLAFN